MSRQLIKFARIAADALDNAELSGLPKGDSMNSDAGGKSALGEELGLLPSAWAVMAHGRVQKLVVRADVADEAVCGWRASDPEATAVPLYTWATVDAAVAAEREQSRVLSDDMLRYAMAALGTGSPQEAERFRAFWLHAMTARYLRACAEAEPVATVPHGWKLVPIAPTPEMLATTSWPGCAATDYAHMLAAAPQPPSAQADAGRLR